MDIPLQVSFKNMDHSEAVEANVREKAAKLDQYFSHLTSCRVVIAAPHRNHHKGNIYHVNIELGVPGRHELAVSNERELNHAHEDVYVAIRDAFETAYRRLKSFAGKSDAKTKRRERPMPGS
jgi:ribosomal subunit interface protein